MLVTMIAVIQSTRETAQAGPQTGFRVSRGQPRTTARLIRRCAPVHLRAPSCDKMESFENSAQAAQNCTSGPLAPTCTNLYQLAPTCGKKTLREVRYPRRPHSHITPGKDTTFPSLVLFCVVWCYLALFGPKKSNFVFVPKRDLSHADLPVRCYFVPWRSPKPS